MKLNIAVFGSGKGSNFKAILEAIQAKSFTVEIKLVISNNSKAGILDIARENKIPCFHISNKQFQSDLDFNTYLLKLFDEYSINFIVLAGYMKKIDSAIINKFKNKILNIHPALIPAFCGANMYGGYVHEAVINYGCKITGVTVHLVDEDYDHGPIVIQKCVNVEDDDTPEILAARVLKVEHEVYPEALKLFAEDKVSINGRKVYIKK